MKYLLFAITAFYCMGCSPNLNYYTKKIHNENHWSDDDLKKIQFYISDDIVLWREINSGESVIQNGKIKMVDGREVEEVIIRKGTKGAYLFSPQKNHYAISFDPNRDDLFLVFGPSEKVNDRYVLLAKEWNRNNGKVTYGEKVFNTTNQSAFANLLVDVDKKHTSIVSKNTAKGRSVK